jgi:glucose-6-phosphate isomerase
MGGSSLAPEVIAAAYKKDFFVLDRTDPSYIAHAILGDLAKTVVVVRSESGSTIETAWQGSLFENEFTQAGLNPTEHMVIFTDPSSPLDMDARSAGFTVVNVDPHVGGRFSTLTAFGLVPAALTGVDVSLLLDAAADALDSFRANQSPAVTTPYLLSYQSGQYFEFSDTGPAMPELSDWIERRIAESTCKGGKGRLLVVIESWSSLVAGQATRIAFSGKSDLVVEGELGGQFIFGEWVTALLGYALKIDPCNQPNVIEDKEASASLLKSWARKLPTSSPDAIDGAVEIFWQFPSVQDALTYVIDALGDDGYIAIMTYLDRKDDEQLAQLSRIIAGKSSRPIPFGWSPRFLHSTDQFNKGENGTEYSYR